MVGYSLMVENLKASPKRLCRLSQLPKGYGCRRNAEQERDNYLSQIVHEWNSRNQAKGRIMKNISAVTLIGRQRNVSENLFVLVQVPQKRKVFPTWRRWSVQQDDFPAIRRPPASFVLTNPTSAGVAPSGCITTSCTYLS
jgi:hypothetical protein